MAPPQMQMAAPAPGGSIGASGAFGTIGLQPTGMAPPQKPLASRPRLPGFADDGLASSAGKFDLYVDRAARDSGPVREEAKKESLASPANVLAEIIALQTFSGSWAWSTRLFALLGVDEAKATTALGGSGRDKNAFATAAVLVFLKTRLASDRDSWEMVAEKARSWLENLLGGEDKVTELEALAKALF